MEEPTVEFDLPLLHGERVFLRLSNVSLLLRTSEQRALLGVLFLTNFRVLHASREPLPASILVRGAYLVSIPVCMINSFKKKAVEGQSMRQIKFYTKDMRCIKLTYNKTKSSEGLVQYFRNFVPLTRFEDAFAFRYHDGERAEALGTTGWQIFDPIEEFRRMGVFPPFLTFPSLKEEGVTPPVEDSPNSDPPSHGSSGSPAQPANSSRKRNIVVNIRKRTTKRVAPRVHKKRKNQMERVLRKDNFDSTPGEDPEKRASRMPRRLSLELSTSPTNKTFPELPSRQNNLEGLDLEVAPTSPRGVHFRHSLEEDLDISSPRSNEESDESSEVSTATDDPSYSPGGASEASRWQKVDSRPVLQRVDSRRGQFVGSSRSGSNSPTTELRFPLPPDYLRTTSSQRPSHARSDTHLEELARHRLLIPPVAPPLPLLPPPPLPPPSTPIWMITNVNESFRVCASYPQYFCVPSQITTEVLRETLRFRSKARIPVLAWKRPQSPVSIIRSSQPLVGMTINSSEGDEWYLKYALALNRAGRRLRIIDARGKNAANANHARGAGYEGSRYTNAHCTIHFMGIENIHTMRESLSKLFQLLKRKEDLWLSALESTGWLRHVRLIMQAARTVVDYIEDQESVLVHCSDGWDRTAQICALAELALDPYFRTLRGFLCLIEKEWLQFGHKFADRLGHAPGASRSEVSPVFLQWMDCVHQLVRQYPCSFEFNGALLVYIVDESFACRFGTFLENSLQERLQSRLPMLTASLWDDILAQRSKFINPLYAENKSVLRFSSKPRIMRLWEEYFLRWDEEATAREDAETKLRYLLQEMERRQMKLASLEKRQRAQPRPMDTLRRQIAEQRGSSFMALQKMTPMSGLELAMRELVSEIIDGALASREYEETGELVGENTQRPWVPEHWSTQCRHCEKKFSHLRRKHHCRNCGHVVCNSCSKSKIKLPHLKINHSVRVCDDCVVLLQGEPCEVSDEM